MITRPAHRTGRRAAAAAVAALALGVPTAHASATSAPADPSTNQVTSTVSSGTLRDLQLDQKGPFDGASALVTLVSHEGTTRASLTVAGAGKEAWNTRFGAHLHEGPCVKGDGDAAGPHYNASTTDPPTVNRETEIWLDHTIRPGAGIGFARATVPFVPTAGERSVVIHEMPTDPSGDAGDRLACLPVTLR